MSRTKSSTKLDRMNSSVLSTRAFKVRSSKGDASDFETLRSVFANWYVIEPKYELMPEGSASDNAGAHTKLFQQIAAWSSTKGASSVDRRDLGNLYQTVSNQLNTVRSEHRVAPPKIHRPALPSGANFRMIRKYDGVISSRSETSFWAEMRENEGDRDVIETEFDIDALPVSDRALAQQGIPVVWTLGVEIDKGTYKNQSIVYLRRIASPPADAVNSSEKIVESRMAQIGWE